MARSRFFSKYNPVLGAIALVEAVAIKITPDYVTTYKYKDGVKAKGLIPVNIKHANIEKHYDQLVDPEPGDPLGNLVIGTIPKYYKKSSDLKPKDPSKSVSDLMDKGEDKPAPEKKEPEFSKDTPAEVQNAAEMLGYKPGSIEAQAVAALFQHKYVFKAHGELATEVAVAKGKPEDDEDTFDEVLSALEKVVEKGQKKGIFSVADVLDDEDEDDDTEYEKVSFSSSLSTPIKKPEKPVAPVAEPVVAPTPTPVSPPEVKPALSPMTSGIPELPPTASLSLVGDAKSSYGGYHAKSLYQDAAGNKFLFKPASSGTMYAAQAAQGYSQVAAKVLGDENIPVVVGSPQGASAEGSIQPIVPNVSTSLKNVNLANLTGPQKETLLKHRVLDWAMSQHDAKADNFLLTKDGKILGIDKDQAFKFLGTDSLDPSYKPNPSPQIYQDLFNLYADKKIDLDMKAMLPAIKQIESMSDDAWLASFSSYLGTLLKKSGGSNTKEITDLKDKMLARKKNLRADLEKLATDLMRKRGDIGPKTKFYFEPPPKKKKKKKSEAGVSLPVASGPSTLPPLSSLVKGGSVPGATNKGTQFYTGPNGEKYVVKQAIARSGPSAPQPWRVAAQVASSRLGEIARPGKTVPVAEVSDGVDGFPATIQKWEDGSSPLGSTSPKDLTDSEKTDIAQEHVVDWLLSQHDTHKNNLLRRKDGTIVGIDKEQGFKFFPNDKLATDYHPNTMEDEPYYNKFWRAFADGSMDFDPKKMLPAIERLEAVSKADYAKEMAPYAKAIADKDGGSVASAKFVVAAVKRKENLRQDFEKFVTDLYRKRTGNKGGNFSFQFGWSGDEPASPPKKKKKKSDVGYGPLQTPLAKGDLGMQNVKMALPEGYTPPKPPPAPPVPPGYPPPDAGKMWKVQSAADFFSPGGAGGIYKIKDAKNDVGQPDPSLPVQMIKFESGVTEEQVKDNLTKLGVTPEKVSTTSSDGKAYAIVDRKAFNAAIVSGKEMAAQVPLPPPPPPPAKDAFTPLPEAGQLQNPEATDSIEELKKLDDKTPIGWGKNYRIGGSSVKDHSLTVCRRLDKDGKIYYDFSFKLREETAEKISVGSKSKSDTYYFPKGTYQKKADALKVTGVDNSDAGSAELQKFSSGQSSIHFGGTLARFAFRNRCYAKVVPEGNETPFEAFKRVLSDSFSEDVADSILKEPTAQEDRLLKLSALYAAVFPQQSDSKVSNIPIEKQIPFLEKKLKEEGYTDEELDSIRMEQVGIGQCVPVLPGRWKKIKDKQTTSYLGIGIGSVDNAVKQILSGSLGVNTRGFMGLGAKGYSAYADQSSGGADSVYCHPVNEKPSNSQFWTYGEIQMIYDPSEMDRLDGYCYKFDNYGSCKPSNSGWNSRKPLEEGTKDSFELLLKSGMNARKLLKIAVNNEYTKKQLVEKLASKGITSLNGMKPEDLVTVVGSNVTPSNFYETMLKPAGY